MRSLASRRRRTGGRQQCHRTRAIAVGRHNWMFVGSDLGGQTAATLMSVVATRRLLRIDTLAWFREVLTRIAQGHPLLETASRRVYPAVFPAPLGYYALHSHRPRPAPLRAQTWRGRTSFPPDTLAIPDQVKRDFHNLDDALHRLASLASRQAKVVESPLLRWDDGRRDRHPFGSLLPDH